MKSERTILYLFAATQFTHIMDFMIIMPLGEMLMDELRISAQQFSFLVASYTITAGITGLMSAFITDNFDRKKYFLMAYAGFSIGTVMCGFAETYEGLISARILTGVFGGLLSSTVLTIVTDVIAPERRAWGIGIVMTAFSLASALGLPIGLSAANAFGWQWPFRVLGLVSAVLAVAAYYVLPPVNAHLQSGSNNTRRTLRFLAGIPSHKNQWMALLFTMLLIFGQFTVVPFITPYLVGNVGFERWEITLVYLVGGLITIRTNPAIGRWADRTSRYKVFMVMALFSILPLLALTNLPPMPVWAALIVTGLFFFVIGGRMVPATTIVTTVIRPENRGSFMSLNTSVQNMTAGVSSVIAGILVTIPAGGKHVEGFWKVGLLACSFTLLAVLLMNQIRRMAAAVSAPAPSEPVPTPQPQASAVAGDEA